MELDGRINRKKGLIFSRMTLVVGGLSVLIAVLLYSLNTFLSIAYGAFGFAAFMIVLHQLHNRRLISTDLGVSLFLFAYIAQVSFLSLSHGGVVGPLGTGFIPLPMVALIFFNIDRSILWFIFIANVCLTIEMVLGGLSKEVTHMAAFLMILTAMASTFSIGCIFRFVIDKDSIQRDKVVEDSIQVLNAYSMQNFTVKLEVKEKASTFAKLAIGINQLGLDLDKTLKELKNYQDNLEDIIEKRTKELQDAHATLINASKLASLGEMAGGIAHEINNPLATIMLRANHIKMILEKESSEHDPKLFEFLSVILETVSRAEKIVAGLRSFSKSGDKDDFAHEKVVEIIQNTLSLCQQQFESHKISLEVSPVSEKLGLECRAVQISQVLLSLLNNARYALKETKGEKIVKLEVLDHGGYLTIAVTDTGSGIPEDIRDKILYPFFTTKQIGEGTGLGLSISKGIVESHGGKLYLDSQSINTRFVIELPKIQGENAIQIA